MTVEEFKKWLADNNVPDGARIAFRGNGDGAFYQVTDEVAFDSKANKVCIGY